MAHAINDEALDTVFRTARTQNHLRPVLHVGAACGNLGSGKCRCMEPHAVHARSKFESGSPVVAKWSFNSGHRTQRQSMKLKGHL